MSDFEIEMSSVVFHLVIKYLYVTLSKSLYPTGLGFFVCKHVDNKTM